MSLDPVFNNSNQRLKGEDSYSDFLVACTRILEIAEESAAFNGHARCLFHIDVLRATTAILQIILREVTLGRTHLDKYISSCRDAIRIGRSLVPKEFARVEETFENLLDAYMPAKMFAN